MLYLLAARIGNVALPARSPPSAASRRSFTGAAASALSTHRRWAKEDRQEVDYDLEALRELVRAALEAGRCPYCGDALTVHNFSLDHDRPPLPRRPSLLAEPGLLLPALQRGEGPADRRGVPSPDPAAVRLGTDCFVLRPFPSMRWRGSRALQVGAHAAPTLHRACLAPSARL